jgi:hypothetical protein
VRQLEEHLWRREARQHAKRAVMGIVAYSAAREKLAEMWDRWRTAGKR